MTKHMFGIGLVGCMLLGVAVEVQSETEDMLDVQAPAIEKRQKKKAKSALTEIVLQGTIRKHTAKVGKKQVTYQLKEPSGAMIKLPPVDIKLDKYIGQDVVVFGLGSEGECKGRKLITLKTVTDIRLAKKTVEEDEGDEELIEEEEEGIENQDDDDPFADVG